jgi:aryl-alcohol dehydrogenase-like predicted oxidoreductase
MKLVLGSQHSSGTYDGLMVLGSDPERTASFYRHAIRIGFTIVDTAPLYARGNAETDIGRSDWSGKVWTKVGVDIDAPLAQRDYRPVAMLRSLRGSARRLGRTPLTWSGFTIRKYAT